MIHHVTSKHGLILSKWIIMKNKDCWFKFVLFIVGNTNFYSPTWTDRPQTDAQKKAKVFFINSKAPGVINIHTLPLCAIPPKVASLLCLRLRTGSLRLPTRPWSTTLQRTSVPSTVPDTAKPSPSTAITYNTITWLCMSRLYTQSKFSSSQILCGHTGGA